MPLLENTELVRDANRRPLIIAHRGASGLAPENTLAAFGLAVASGANGVEMDVQLSADGHPVVIHDRRVNRTTDGTGAVANLTADQIGRLDAARWFERRLARRPRVRALVERAMAIKNGSKPFFGGEYVPTLEAVLALLGPAGLERIYIELKGENSQGLLDATVSVIRQAGLERSVTLLSFNHEIIRRAKESAPEFRAAVTLPAVGRALVSARSIIRSAEDAGADEVALHFSLATRRTVSALHGRALAVSAWTVNNRVMMRRLLSCGVDSIMTDFPDRLVSVMESPPPKRLTLSRNPIKRKRRDE